ncbi:MAG: 3-deoxy-D-manno-octulosonic acid transferase [Planctomycetota bacterium]|nr:MAG: 3-deoxy-D-manno-octulosonic acid transferase [Planctomycetota bacterium]
MRGRRFDAAYLLYDVLLYLVGLALLPLLLVRVLLRPRRAVAVRERLGLARRDPRAAGALLLHGVSVGEVAAMRPLIERIRRRHPELRLAVSSTTPSGRATARRLFPDLPVFTFPLDLPFACRAFLRRVRPRAVVLMELEIWPNFLRACNRFRLPVAIVNGRITERSMTGYRRVHRLLPQFDRILVYGVQNERYAERFRRLAVPPERIRITGNLKYDAVPECRPGREPQEPWRGWCAGRPALVVGSSHEPEEVEILRAVAARPELARALLLIVPRHPERAPRLRRELEAVADGRPVLLRSEQANGRPLPAGAVFLVDTFGELEQVYRCGRVAVVGGSLVPHGGQNVLEPAALGLPVLVGPHTENFAEEVELLAAVGGLRRASDPSSLVTCAAEWMADPATAEACGRAGAAALAARRGAAASTLRLLEETVLACSGAEA